VKVVILAGGLGSRLSEETEIRPKPMVEIGQRPILWHIMKHYAHYGHKDFAIALGYKGDYIKKWMVDQAGLAQDLTVSLQTGTVKRHDGDAMNEDWTIDLIDTGLHTQTGGRIRRMKPYVNNETFMLTWGDGVSDIDLDDLLRFHRSHGKLVTMTAVRPPARFGHLVMDGDVITDFNEKPQAGEGWINGAFFVVEPEAIEYVTGDPIHWEREPLEGLAKDGQLMAYKHHSFWQCMDTIREKQLLQSLWDSGNPPWKVWE
jgi:glucose-1-phosphate cytidylyltransferase